MLLAQWTLCDPMDWDSPGFSVHGILQARVLELVAISFPKRTPILIANIILGFPVLKIYINEVLQFLFVASLLWLKIIFNISFIPLLFI